MTGITRVQGYRVHGNMGDKGDKHNKGTRITVFSLGILLHIPCIFPLQGLLEYIYGLLQEYVRRSIPGVHIPKSPGIEHLRISWIFGSPVLKHPKVVPVAIPDMFSLS